MPILTTPVVSALTTQSAATSPRSTKATAAAMFAAMEADASKTGVQAATQCVNPDYSKYLDKKAARKSCAVVAVPVAPVVDAKPHSLPVGIPFTPCPFCDLDCTIDACCEQCRDNTKFYAMNYLPYPLPTEEPVPTHPGYVGEGDAYTADEPCAQCGALVTEYSNGFRECPCTVALTIHNAMSIYCNRWDRLSDVRKAEIANFVLGNKAVWETLEPADKARIAAPVIVWLPMECDETGRKLTAKEQAESLVVRCQSPSSGNIYDTVYCPGLNVVRCTCQAGRRRADCYHAIARLNRDAELIEAVYQKVPRLPSQASSVERGELLIASGIMNIAEDF